MLYQIVALFCVMFVGVQIVAWVLRESVRFIVGFPNNEVERIAVERALESAEILLHDYAEYRFEHGKAAWLCNKEFKQLYEIATRLKLQSIALKNDSLVKEEVLCPVTVSIKSSNR